MAEMYTRNDRGPQFDLTRDQTIEARVRARIMANYVDHVENAEKLTVAEWLEKWDPRGEDLVI